jgi:hypothetical protein
LYPLWCVNRFFHRVASSVRLMPHAWMLLKHGETAYTTWRFNQKHFFCRVYRGGYV